VQDAPIRRREFLFEGAGGLDLFGRAWLPERAQRSVLLVHGWAEHSGRYEHVGAWLAARGCAVHAYDHRGHGRSAGPRGHARRFADLLDDLEIALARAREESPALPVFLLGHSMGGLVVAAFVAERGPEITGAVTSGAALALADVPSRARLALLRLAARVAPRMRRDRPIAGEALSRDPEVGRAYAEDPLVLRRMTLGFGAALLDAARRTQEAAGAVRVPMLLLHGADDTLTLAEGSRRFHAGLSAPASDLRLYAGLRHEILNEPERETVLDDLLGWMRSTEAVARRAAPAPLASGQEAGRAG
jgi:alpha-beta hydrolase superfamily lysophospholipase